MYIHSHETNQDCRKEGGTTLLEFGHHHCQYMTNLSENCCGKLRLRSVALEQRGIASDPMPRNSKKPLRR
jgi:hypothetical protein